MCVDSRGVCGAVGGWVGRCSTDFRDAIIDGADFSDALLDKPQQQVGRYTDTQHMPCMYRNTAVTAAV
jgi:hypothetical protein